MRKNLLRIVCIVMALCMLPVHAFAAEQATQEDALTGAAAINYVQKSADFVGSEFRTVTTDQGNRMEFIVDTYTKTTSADVTTAAMARSGDTATAYETTTYEVWNTRASGSVSDQGGDRYGYAMMTVTVNYTEFTQSGVTFQKIARVSGTYTIISSGAEMYSHSYTLEEEGFRSDGQFHYCDPVNYSLTRSRASWSYTVDNSMFPGIVIEREPDGHQGAVYWFTIASTESTDKWTGSIDTWSYGKH